MYVCACVGVCSWIDALIFPNLFWNKTLHVSDSFSVHHQEFFTVYTAVVYVIQVPSWSCSQAVGKPVWHIPLLCIHWKIPDGEQRNCPKHVEFYSKNKFGKISASSWFIIRIFHDARSPVRHIRGWTLFLWQYNGNCYKGAIGWIPNKMWNFLAFWVTTNVCKKAPAYSVSE